ncbi:hypothetical protein PR202_gb16842 [Eleusine coracana subsp. coracana]|uniref:DUF1618 domain-containing protein n=1 Tax=Eleusine coracana subsp. coracana TaxID=191504 RepID=A0AAV5F177_ELECO|nr:hypothetical protein PR202_gb16842 [Eleusine coracana subsp. coracana]
MEGVQATQQSSSSSMATYPPWVMLEPFADVETTGSYSTANPNTLVVARTSAGHPIGVSLRIASPPAQSRVCIHFPRGSDPVNYENQVIAAHGDSVLIRVALEQDYDTLRDYFVYNAGDAAADSPQPASLSLLPPCYRYLVKDSTGILRRSEDELVVARLEIVRPNDETPKEHVVEMLLLRNCKWWLLRWPRIIDDLGADELRWWRSSTVIPVGDHMLCWVCKHQGLFFCNVFDENLVLRYVRLPDRGPQLQRKILLKPERLQLC